MPRLWRWAWSVQSTIGQLNEFMHGRNRARALVFFFNTERENCFVWASKALKDDSGARQCKRHQGGWTEPQRSRKRSALDIFRAGFNDSTKEKSNITEAAFQEEMMEACREVRRRPSVFATTNIPNAITPLSSINSIVIRAYAVVSGWSRWKECESVGWLVVLGSWVLRVTCWFRT